MKGIVIAAILIIGQIATAHANNPQRRACLNNNSIFWTLDITEPKKDNVGFCKWGEPMVGSISMMEFYNESIETLAMKAFLNTKTTKYRTCKSAGADQISGVDSNDKVYRLCVFKDYSFIRKSTLTNGWYHSSNYDLIQNL